MVAKKKKNIDTIKIEGLSSDTIEEFAPKDNSEKEDKLWEEYFRGSPNVLDFPIKEQGPPLPSKEFNEKEHATVSTTATPTEATTPATVETATTIDRSGTVGKGGKTAKPEKEYITLDSTHAKSEQIVYSIMYRSTISKGKSQEYFSIRKLMKSTGIGSDTTVSKALHRLVDKLSIQMVEHSYNRPKGTLYRVYNPHDIFKLREDAGIIVDINTKRIVHTVAASATPVAIPKTPTEVKNTTAATVENTTVESSTPYINKNKEINIDNDSFNHKQFITILYEKYTNNAWRVSDDEFYETVKDLIPYVIEAGIIASVMRAKGTVNSLAYCEGAIQEFNSELPPGYLNYLREKWDDWKQTGEKKKPKKRQNKSKTKKDIGRIYNFIYQTRIGGERETTLEEDVQEQCKTEGIGFSDKLFEEIQKESEHGRWEPKK